MAWAHGTRRAAVLALSLLCAPRVRAQLPDRVVIDWDDQASCPRPLRLSLESEVARLLGVNADNAPATQVDARIERIDTLPTRPYRLSLRMRGDALRAERQMDLATCSEAQDAAAVLIASALDPDALAQEDPVAPPSREEEKPAPPMNEQRWSLFGRALFDLHALPKPAGGLAFGGLYQRARFRAWSEARYLFARRTDSAFTPPVHADVDLFTVVGGGAYVWPFGEFVVGPAVELELGVLRGRGGGATRALRETGPWGAVDLGGVAGWGISRRVGVELSLYAGLPMWRPQLAVRNEGTLYTTNAVTMRVAVGVRVSLGSR